MMQNPGLIAWVLSCLAILGVVVYAFAGIVSELSFFAGSYWRYRCNLSDDEVLHRTRLSGIVLSLGSTAGLVLDLWQWLSSLNASGL